MSNHNKQYSKPTKGYSTIVGLICFTIIKLLLLSMLAWFIIIVYLSVQIVLAGNESVASKIQSIVNVQSNVIAYCQPLLLKKIMVVINQMYIKVSLYFNETILIVLMGSFEVVAIRLLIFILYLPFIGLQFLIFMIDGLVQRDIRKFQGAKESSLIFHRLQASGGFLLSLLFLIYMALPQAFQPGWMLIPMSILLGLFISFSIKNFKKYL